MSIYKNIDNTNQKKVHQIIYYYLFERIFETVTKKHSRDSESLNRMVAKESCIRISHSFASFLIVNNRDRVNMILLSNGSISNWIFFLILRINKLVLRIVISSHSFICTYFKQFYRTAKWEMSRKFQEKNSKCKIYSISYSFSWFFY